MNESCGGRIKNHASDQIVFQTSAKTTTTATAAATATTAAAAAKSLSSLVPESINKSHIDWWYIEDFSLNQTEP